MQHSSEAKPSSNEMPQEAKFSATIIKRGRKLQKEDDVLTENAWDDTEWTEEMCQAAEKQLQEQRDSSKYYRAGEEQISRLELEVTNRWDEFYRAHEDKFFKDRKWIFSEFPELLEGLQCDSGECNILEAGCGVGNAVVHILANNHNPQLHVYCCDLSGSAIDTLKKRDFYLQNSTRVTPFQADICKDFSSVISKTIKPDSLDFIMLIFTASALRPDLMRDTIKNLSRLLKAGGMILFRDYARYDLTQLRFKGSALLRDNYYLRSDGTTSYFFTHDELDEILGVEGTMIKEELTQDNRLLVNRLKGIKMCRCWIQAKYRRPHVQDLNKIRVTCES